MVLDWKIFFKRNTLKLLHKSKGCEAVFYTSTIFFHCLDGVFHVCMWINHIFNLNKKSSLDETGGGNVVLDLTISD